MLIEKILSSIDFIRSETTLRPQIGLTLGSGLGAFCNKVDVVAKIPYKNIPHFAPTTVEGHSGNLILGHLRNIPLAILQGRIHFYEGHSMEDVVYPTRILAQLGIETLVLTNAAGGIDPKMKPGHFMIIEDHINLTGQNPLVGPNIHELGLRFPDMSDAYDEELNSQLEKIFTQKKIPFSRGVYCGVSGPTYETAAEVRYLRTIGGQAVGMSTVPENIAAKHMGLRVCGVSCITNLATGILDQKVTHDEVTETTQRVEKDFCEVIEEFILQM